MNLADILARASSAPRVLATEELVHLLSLEDPEGLAARQGTAKV